jgi:hypothetical protein
MSSEKNTESEPTSRPKKKRRRKPPGAITYLPVVPVENIAGELLTGDRLVEFIFGPQPDLAALKKVRRKLYRLASEVPAADRLPTFRLGPRELAGRVPTLTAWLGAREQAALAALGIVAAANPLPQASQTSNLVQTMPVSRGSLQEQE